MKERKRNRQDAVKRSGAQSGPVGLSEQVTQLFNKGLVCHKRGELTEAAVLYRRVLDLNPQHSDALHLLGVIAYSRGDNSSAEGLINKAIALNARSAAYHANLALVLVAAGRLERALAACDAALSINPNYAIAQNSRGNILRRVGRLDEALLCFDAALSLQPNFEQAHNNRGNALKDLGRIDEALAAFEVALRIRPGYLEAHNSRIMALHYREHSDALAIFRAARAYSVQVGEAEAADVPADAWKNSALPERPLRIGYVSGDFRRHPVGYFLEGVLSQHQVGSMEAICFQTSALSDDLTERLKASSKGWFGLTGLTDSAARQRVRQSGIDILVDLAGHTAHNRLPLFAKRSAPVQVTWLGYFGTTGLSTMDYILADGTVVPEGEDALFTETVWRLPHSYLCFTEPDDGVDIRVRPENSDALTFCSFNNIAKITPATIIVWARLLTQLPGARLFLRDKAFASRFVSRQFLERFRALGVEPARIRLEGAATRSAYLAGYNEADIALSPFPFGGGTTTAEALWMGVPVVALRGATWVGRISETILSSVGLADFVAVNEEDYIRIAVSLALDGRRRSVLRGQLRGMLRESSLCDAAAFTLDLEMAYRGMWREWCRGQ